MARGRNIRLLAPYLKRIWLELEKVENPDAYPFCLPLFRKGFDQDFTKAITIIVGENGSGKSTLLEGIAALAGFDQAGGGKGYMPVDHSRAMEVSGDILAQALKASWLPRLSNGWFFKAESFFSVARYLDKAALENYGPAAAPDFLSHSHGEGFLRFFDERLDRQGFYIFDEPESALSPSRQIEFLKILMRIDQAKVGQVIMATHAPILMACPGATLLRIDKYGLYPVALEDTDHFRLMREFCNDPKGFVETMTGD
ncbi:MAG: AAA family ATPase [Alphaproteobacteria bacterium]|nr:AAA family ATPase [Alphaproteobacteria bacterium]